MKNILVSIRQVDGELEDGKLGRCSRGIQPTLILIREDLPRPVKYSVLLHEIRHAMDDKVSDRELRAMFAQVFFCGLGFLGACWMKFKWWMDRKGGGAQENPLQVVI